MRQTRPDPAQPKNWKFIDELKLPERRIFNWKRRVPIKKESNLSAGIRLIRKFPNSSGSLQTAYDDLEKFFFECGIPLSGNYEISTEMADDNCTDDRFKMVVAERSCRIIAGNAEGIRRAIYHLEDLLLGSDGPFLKIGEVNRKPWIKNRISRCFFGPIKRPPLNRDELMDDVDYYPEEYLNRLAHEGINGLWLTITFKDLCKTTVAPEYGKDAERRLAKLRRTVDKCLRYGIKTYIFCIEPAAWSADSTVLARYPVLGGARWSTGSLFCPFSDTAQKYLYESVNGIFKSVPGLGGIINISHGERATTCLCAVSATEDRIVDCPVCSQKKHWEILYASLSAMEKGMHAAAPDAQLISWLYMPETNELAQWVFEIPKHTPQNVTLQFNFESGGTKEQNGKLRTGGDYWLSYVGPSDRFKRIAESANASGTSMSAKIQVGCSHEVATVPFVPVPGQLFRKYREMQRLGVSNVMQCWYFGNYPGIMNKTAGLLAFEDFHNDEKCFLKSLALPEWGHHADDVVSAWMFFTEAYSNYPFSNIFQYYGPMHDGVVWPLYLYPAYKTLSPTWLLQFGTSGDLIGECLDTHTLEEAKTLCHTLSEKWNQGVEILKAIRKDFENNPPRLKDIGVAEALGIQFKSGYNILCFYALRERLFNDKSSGQQSSILDEMEAIVRSEINRSKRLMELSRSDSRLGFHSEAEGYKYFPKKLQWRIKSLETLLAKDFSKARKSLNAGELKLPQRENVKKYACDSVKFEQCETFRWKASCSTSALNFDIECDNKGASEEQIFLTLLNATVSFPIIIDVNRISGIASYSASGCLATVSDSSDGWKVKITVPFSVFRGKPGNVLSLSIIRYACIDGKTTIYAWEGASFAKYRLGIGFYKDMGSLFLSADKIDLISGL